MKKPDVIEETYRRESGHLLAWLRSRVGPEAEDILHDVFSSALSDLDALEPVRDLAAWLWRGARNAVIDAWRRRTRRGRFEGDSEELDDIVDIASREAFDEIEEDELLDALEDAIRALPPEQREVIVAQGLEGETFAAISVRTGVSIDTLAGRKRYALARIRASLEEFR